jgi:hypothetical protein
MWKTVEKFEVGKKTASAGLVVPVFKAARFEQSPMKLGACSACAGDYEDPDWSSEPDGDEVDDECEVVNNVEEWEQE